jgi:hypothetical protein
MFAENYGLAGTSRASRVRLRIRNRNVLRWMVFRISKTSGVDRTVRLAKLSMGPVQLVA